MAIFDFLRPKKNPLLPEKGVFDSLDLEALKESLSKSNFSQIIAKIRERQITREKRFVEYEVLANDPIIGQAIEMMSDDATQFDLDREKTVWVESEDEAFAKEINLFLKKMVEPYIDSIAASILKCGEFAFRVYQEMVESTGESTQDKEQGDVEISLFPIKNLQNLHHIVTQRGEHFYLYTDNIATSKEMVAYDYTEFIHFINYSIINSEEVEITFKTEDKETKKVETRTEKVFLLSGESLITDRISQLHKILITLEDGIIATRLAKSKLVRFINVEVGKVPDEKIPSIIQYVDGLVNKTEEISSTSDYYSAERRQVEPVSVVMPVRDDKGRVTIEEFSTSADIKEIADIEYFRDLFFASLRVPKAFFGIGEAMPGSGSGSFLRMDIKYARGVKKVQRVMVNGIKDLVAVLVSKKKLSKKDFKVPEYTVKVVKISSAEDMEKNEEIALRVDMVNNLMTAFWDDNTSDFNMKKITVAKKFFEQVVPVNALSTFLKGISIKSEV